MDNPGINGKTIQVNLDKSWFNNSSLLEDRCLAIIDFSTDPTTIEILNDDKDLSKEIEDMVMNDYKRFLNSKKDYYSTHKEKSLGVNLDINQLLSFLQDGYKIKFEGDNPILYKDGE